MNTPSPRWSLAHQFVMASLPILMLATWAVALWVGEEVKGSVLRRVGGATALYVDGFLAPHVQSLHSGQALGADDLQALRRATQNPALRAKAVAIKIWSTQGVVLFSSDGQGVGQQHAIDHGLAAAIKGDIGSHISQRTAQERLAHGQAEPGRVIETYTPLRQADTGVVVAVAETYQATSDHDIEAARAQWRSWAVVASVMTFMYGLIFALVRRGSRTIENQRRALDLKLAELTRLQQQNKGLHENVMHAAQQAMLVNEGQLRRIAANVHDGPIQDLGLALMKLGSAPESPGPRLGNAPLPGIEPVRHAVRSALDDLRAICADLDLPEIADRSLPEVAARALRDFQSKTGRAVPLHHSGSCDSEVPLPAKVAVYRLLQEALANAHRHAALAPCNVVLQLSTGGMSLVVTNAEPLEKPGKPTQDSTSSQMGLRGMAHRVAVLQGELKMEISPAGAASLHVWLPLPGPAQPSHNSPEPADERSHRRLGG